jgi:hypothetical protein
MTRTLLAQAINRLWESHGAGALEKNAAAHYFYELKKPVLDAEVFGEDFCKMAYVLGKDPWALAIEVHDNLPRFELLRKTASGKELELASFYLESAKDICKKAGLIDKAVGGVKNTFGIGRKTLSTPAQVETLTNKAHGLKATAKGTKARLTQKRLSANQPMPASMAASANPPTLTKAQRQQMAAAESAKRGVQANPRQQRVLSGQAGTGPVVRPSQPAVSGTAAPATVPANQVARPQSAPAQATAPVQGAAPAQGAVPEVQGQTPQSNWTNRAIGAAALGVPAAGYMAFSGANPQPQPPPGYGY